MASSKISVKPVMDRGEKRYRVRYWDTAGKLKRPLFTSKKSADAFASGLRGQASHAEQVWAGLTAEQRNKLIASFENQSIVESPKIGVVISELITAKQKAGRSKVYTDTLEIILGQFSASNPCPINAITLGNIEKFLDSKSLASRSTLRARLSTLFNFAVRRGYRADNPCARLEAVTVIKTPPAVFTPEQFKSAIKWLLKNTPYGLPWFALSTVCGLRPEEAEKTTKADIHFGEGFIKVEAQTTKVRQRRIVYPRKEAMKFLKWALKHGRLPLDAQVRKRMISGSVWRNNKGARRSEGLRQALGFKVWPKDITRHTAASYWLAGGDSAGHVSEMLGNSEKVLKRDYKALVTRVQAEEFWNVVSSITKKYTKDTKQC